MDIYDRLNEIFRDVLDNDEIVLKPGITAADVDEWDSLSHIRIIVAIEQAFGIKFAVTEIGNLKDVGELVGVIQAKLG